MDHREFEQVVEEALEALPEKFVRLMENVAVVVDEEPDPEVLAKLDMDTATHELFGLYVGTPLTERDVSHADLPDRVYVYRGPILRNCSTPEEIRSEILDTVVHELGHHMGLSDEEMPY